MDNFLHRLVVLPSAARFCVMAGLGVVAALGQAPLDLWPATLLGLVAAMLIYRQCAPARQAALMVWAFGIGYFAFSLRWIIEPFLVDLARHGWMAPFALLFMAAGGGAFWGLAGYVAARVAPRNIALLGLGLGWAEVTRSLVLSGFPWALLGHIWVPTWVAQLGAFGGPHLLTFITVLLAWSLCQLVLRQWAAIVLIASVAGASFLLRPPGPEPLPDGPVVRLVQPNAPQHQKWDSAYRDIFVSRMLALTAQGDVPDLVIWPETSVPTLLNFIEDDLSVLADAARGAPLVFGIQRRDDVGQYYNSFVVMEAGGKISGVYDKRHLVPFGEYIPGGRWFSKLGVAGLADMFGGGFASGSAPGAVSLPGIGDAVPLICYEGIFAEEIHRDAARSRLMVLITNDAWFGKSVGPLQHLAQARLRAIEQGLPMARAANTGVAAMIDAYGRIIDAIPLGTDGAIDVALPAARPPTFYSRWGDNPVVLLLILLSGSVYLNRTRNSD